MKALSNDALWAAMTPAQSTATPKPTPERVVGTTVGLTEMDVALDDVITASTVDESLVQAVAILQPEKPPSTAVQPAMPKPVAASADVSQQAFCLDHVQQIAPGTFPNQPRVAGHQLPGTISNLKHLLDVYGITVRYDVIKKKLRITLPGNSGTADNADNVALTTIISLAAQNGLPIGQALDYVVVLGDRNAYNPVAEWITSKRWDGKDRRPEMYATITAREGFPGHLKERLIYRWQLSAVAAALVVVGFKARGVLTLQGAQGLGKTSWVRSLVTDEVLREMVVKVDHHMDGGNKDSILGAITHWIVEVGELDSSFKKDIARLKGFLTSDHDKVRRPYAHTESEYQRRTVFCATVNESNFLVDTTGNSRWWTIPVTHINFNHGIDMQQLFAQLAEDVNKGEQWWLTPEEETLLESCNGEHLSISVIRERLMEIVDLERIGEHDNPAMTATEVLTKLEFDRPTNPQCKECAAILRQLFGDSKKIQGQHKWRIPLQRQKPTKVDYTGIDDDRY